MVTAEPPATRTWPETSTEPDESTEIGREENDGLRTDIEGATALEGSDSAAGVSGLEEERSGSGLEGLETSLGDDDETGGSEAGELLEDEPALAGDFEGESSELAGI